MTDARELTPAERFRITLELFDSGVALMRENLRREYPTESEAQIEERVREWLRQRPGAEHGDCVGRPVDWNARRR